VDHRHLLPSEIDLLLDGDAGFALAPLRAHVRRCAECQGEVEAARQVVALLDDLPHYAPSASFANRVMADVQVFEPWHVTLADSVRRLVPASRPARILAGAGALTTAFAMTVGVVALLGRLDLVVFVTEFLAGRARAAVIATLGDAVTAVFGEVAAGALARSGSVGVALGAAAFLGSLVLATLLLRALTLAYHRQRS
jgi:hypothetical protein